MIMLPSTGGMSANRSKATYFDDGLPDRLATIAQIRSTIATIKNMTVNAALNASSAPLGYFGVSCFYLVMLKLL